MAFVMRTGNGAGDYSIFGTDTGGTNAGLHLIVRNRKYYMGFYNNDCASPTGSTLNKWEHVAFNYDGRTMKIYVNGKLTKTCPNKNPFTGTSIVNLGQWAKGRRWVGGIRGAKIYEGVLSAAQIMEASETDGLIYEQTGEATSFPKPIGKAPGLGFTLPAFTAMALVKRTGDGAGDYSIYGTDTGGTNKGLHLIVRNRKYYMGFYSNDCASPTGSTLNRWEHVAFVYGGRAMKIYVNGKLTKTCTNKNPFTGTSTVNIGQWASTRKWVGIIRDAKIYDRALSAAEILKAGDIGVEFKMFAGASCGEGYAPITESWQRCEEVAKAMGYTGDSVNYVEYNYPWGTSRPQGCFRSDGNNRFHFNRGAGGAFQGNDKIVCQATGEPVQERARDCQDMMDAGSSEEGEFMVYPFGDETAMKVWCRFDHGKARMSILVDEDNNYSKVAKERLHGNAGHKCSSSWRQDDYSEAGYTTFKELFLQRSAEGLFIDVDEFDIEGTFESEAHAWSATNGKKTYYKKNIPVGYAGDCYSWNACAAAKKGSFKIDLTGTGFAVDASVTWQGKGWGNGRDKMVNFKREQNGQVISANCGAWCGRCEPTGHIFLKPVAGYVPPSGRRLEEADDHMMAPPMPSEYEDAIPLDDDDTMPEEW